MPGRPLNDDERRQHGRTPACFGPGVRAWPGDVVVRMPGSSQRAPDQEALRALELESGNCARAIEGLDLEVTRCRSKAIESQDRFRAARNALLESKHAAARANAALMAIRAQAEASTREPIPTFYVVLAAEDDRIVIDAQPDG